MPVSGFTLPSATATRSKSAIRSSIVRFASAYEHAKIEQAERQSFWNDFFSCFGIDRRQVANFEHLARRSTTGHRGWIDLLYPGQMAVEHKSSGEDLDVAMQQLHDYLPSLSPAQHPWLLVCCDFQTFKWRDLTGGRSGAFSLAALEDHLDLFWWIAGYGVPHESFEDEEEASLEATERLVVIHDLLAGNRYTGHDLREWMTRILFCLFADDTGIWGRAAFHSYIATHTRPDGSDLGPIIARAFQVLDTPDADRPRSLDPDLAQLTYINGGLFKEVLPIAPCDGEIREALLHACRFEWSAISPAIFGSMFQNVMEPPERRRLGAHYTSEENILRTIRPLFLDELGAVLENSDTKPKLRAFLGGLSRMTFLDPACGCGNFLVIAYREIRRLETEALRRLRAREGKTDQMSVDMTIECRVRVDQFYGIEIEEFPAKIARTALYLIDHLANREVSVEFGQHFVRFPIPTAPHIVIGNALRVDWASVLPPSLCSCLLGNPPFMGKKERTEAQRQDMEVVFGRTGGVGVLDYVTAWYKKAIDYLDGSIARAAFVSTNSITCGEQPPVLWRSFGDTAPFIHFAHRTFNWRSEARGAAHVHCVIIGFSRIPPARPLRLFDYPDINGEAKESAPSNINAYLVDGPSLTVAKRRSPVLAAIPTAREGNKLGDWGHLTFDAEGVAAVRADRIAAKYLRRLMGAEEMLNDLERWCLWLEDVDPADVRASPLLQRRLAAVRDERARSDKPSTREMADKPGEVLECRQPSQRYLLLPCVSSSRRRYIPMKFYDPDVIIRTPSSAIEGATSFEFGYLHSAMFMAWVRTVSGRLKSDYQVSAGTVYNTFPFVASTDKQRIRLEQAAEAVLAVRDSFGRDSLAALYDPVSTPPALVDAHRALDESVDALYAPRRKFSGDADRLALLFDHYARCTRSMQAAIGPAGSDARGLTGRAGRRAVAKRSP